MDETRANLSAATPGKTNSADFRPSLIRGFWRLFQQLLPREAQNLTIKAIFGIIKLFFERVFEILVIGYPQRMYRSFGQSQKEAFK